MTIQRIVCFKFKDGIPDNAIDQHMSELENLRSMIPQIIEYRAGITKPSDYNNMPEYDSMHYMTFISMEDIETYFHHPAHQQFMIHNRNNWEKIFVLNSEID